MAAEEGTAAHYIRTHGGPYSLCAWHELQATLAAVLPTGLLNTEAAFSHYEEGPAGVTVHFGGGSRPVAARLLVGCDGAQSAVRQQLLVDGPPDYLGSAIWRGVAPLPGWWPGPGTYCLWLRQPLIVRAFPLPGRGTVVWQAYAPWPAARLADIGGRRAAYVQDPVARREAGEARKARALEAFDGWCAEVHDLFCATDALAITEHGQFCRRPDACKVWARGRVALLGDAARQPTQFLAQGTSQAFEDALELGRAVGEHGPTPEALAAYEAARQPGAEAVHRHSLQMFEDFQAGRFK
ncbi:hypothetical protein ABPG75_013957 [Micractinium tetrahymenae]